MHSTLALGLAAFAGIAVAQSNSQNDYPYRIDPESVSSANRQYWCDQNVAQCPLICSQQPGVTSLTTETNECDPDQLTYSCVCENGVSPNITQYSQTLPFYICQEWGNQCAANCNGDNTCADSCRADHPCGAQDPYRGNATLSSSMSTSAPTGASASSTRAPVTGFGGAAATSGSGGSSGGSTGAAAATFVPGAATSMAVLLGSVFFGFAVLL